MDRLEEYNIECMLINDNQVQEDELIKEYERNSMDRLIEPNTVIATGDEAYYKIKALQEPMRDSTPKEQKSVNDYIKSISKPTRVEFDEEQEQLDFVEEVINLKWQGEALEAWAYGNDNF